MSPFSPINTLDRGIGGIFNKTKKAGRTIAGSLSPTKSSGFHNFDNQRKRKHDEMKPRYPDSMSTRRRLIESDKSSPKEERDTGPIHLESDEEETSSKDQPKTTEEVDTLVPVLISYKDKESETGKSKPSVTIPKNKVLGKYVEFPIEDFQFGISEKYNSSTLSFRLIIMPKRAESSVQILLDGQEIPDMTCKYSDVDRIDVRFGFSYSIAYALC